MRLQKCVFDYNDGSYEIGFTYLGVYYGYMKHYYNNEILKQIIFNKQLGNEYILERGLDIIKNQNKRKFWL